MLVILSVRKGRIGEPRVLALGDLQSRCSGTSPTKPVKEASAYTH